MATQTNSRSEDKPQGRLQFKPVDYGDTGHGIEPDAAIGEYEAVIDDVVPRVSKDGYGQLKVRVKLETAADQENPDAVKSEGATIDAYWTFKEGRDGNFTKRQYTAAAKAIGIDMDQLPTSIKSEADLKEYVDAFKGQRLTLWVTQEEDRETSEMRARLNFTKPRSMGTDGAMSDLPDEEEKPAARGGKAKSGKSARR